jgi:hypothetical protein
MYKWKGLSSLSNVGRVPNWRCSDLFLPDATNLLSSSRDSSSCIRHCQQQVGRGQHDSWTWLWCWNSQFCYPHCPDILRYPSHPAQLPSSLCGARHAPSRRHHPISPRNFPSRVFSPWETNLTRFSPLPTRMTGLGRAWPLASTGRAFLGTFYGCKRHGNLHC